jgi:hypothetical protein
MRYRTDRILIDTRRVPYSTVQYLSFWTNFGRKRDWTCPEQRIVFGGG